MLSPVDEFYFSKEINNLVINLRENNQQKQKKTEACFVVSTLKENICILLISD